MCTEFQFNRTNTTLASNGTIAQRALSLGGCLAANGCVFAVTPDTLQTRKWGALVTSQVNDQTNMSLFPEPTFFESLDDIQRFYNASKTRHVLVGLAFESNTTVSGQNANYTFILEKDFVPTTQCFLNNAVDTTWLHKTNSSLFIEDGILDLQHILNEIIADDMGYNPVSITADWQMLPSMAKGNASVVLTNVAPTLIAIFQCIAINSFLTTTTIDIVTERTS